MKVLVFVAVVVLLGWLFDWLRFPKTVCPACDGKKEIIRGRQVRDCGRCGGTGRIWKTGHAPPRK